MESDPISIALAKKNQEANGVKNAQFVLAKAESLSWVARPKDVVVVDPPRSGLHPKLLDVLINQGPNCLVYISCNYQVLASELTSLLTAYSCETIRLMDFFPHTPHVEVLIKLMRKKTF